MNYYLTAGLGQALLISVIIALVRFKIIDPSYYPFVFLLWIGWITDVVSIILQLNHINSTGVINVYSLIESLLIIWLFNSTGFLKKNILYWIGGIFILGWCIETFYFHIENDLGIYFTVLYSFITVLISINTVNVLFISETRSLLKNAMFLICMAYIIYFTFQVLTMAFWLYGLKMSIDFLKGIYYIEIFINLFANLIFALATLWIPEKQPSILQ